MYTCVAVFAIVALKPKAQANLAVGIVCGIWLYMVLRIVDLFPIWRITGFLTSLLGPSRAGSLPGYRFWNEDFLIARAMERPIFGWGGWGRNKIASDGTILITDGAWIIVFGVGGFMN